jgi:hypothetical protein
MEQQLARFAADPDSLQPEELEALLDAAEGDPDLARELFESMLVGDLLSRRLDPDRARFARQVEERIRPTDSAFVRRVESRIQRRKTWRVAAGIMIFVVAGIAAAVLGVLNRESGSPPDPVAEFEPWSRTYTFGDDDISTTFHGQVVRENGEILAVGPAAFSDDDWRAALIRVSPEGEVIRSIQLVPDSFNFIVRAACSDGADGMIVAGLLNGQPYIARVDGQLNLQWQYILDVPIGRGGFYSLARASNGDFYAAGQTSTAGMPVPIPEVSEEKPYEGYNAVWVTRFSPEGQPRWTRFLDGSSTVKTRGFIIAHVEVTVLANDDLGLVTIADKRHLEGSDIWVVRMDKDGNPKWQRTFGDGTFNGVKGVTGTRDGGMAILGTRNSNQIDSTGWLIRVDVDGDPIWQQDLEIPGRNLSGGKLLERPDGGLLCSLYGIIPGEPRGRSVLLRTEASGAFRWAREINDSDKVIALNLIPVGEETIVLAGGRSILGKDVLDARAWLSRDSDALRGLPSAPLVSSPAVTASQTVDYPVYTVTRDATVPTVEQRPGQFR